jgi:hypothetical protein
LHVDFTRLVAGISDRHVEIMRGELATILRDATRDDVEYLVGDTIVGLNPDTVGPTPSRSTHSPRPAWPAICISSARPDRPCRK